MGVDLQGCISGPLLVLRVVIVPSLVPVCMGGQIWPHPSLGSGVAVLFPVGAILSVARWPFGTTLLSAVSVC